MDITEFLLARIAETERAVEAASEYAVRVMFGSPTKPAIAITSPDGETLWTSDLLRAECEAKRRIVELSWHHLGDDDYAWGMEEAKRQILTLMALPYADHPDYDETWRP